MWWYEFKEGWLGDHWTAAWRKDIFVRGSTAEEEQEMTPYVFADESFFENHSRLLMKELWKM
jgi:hypothetical protein